MKKRLNFLFHVVTWLFLSWIPLRINDYDYREAVPWQEQNAVLVRYFAIVLAEAIILAGVHAAIGGQKWHRQMRYLVIGACVCSMVATLYYRAIIPWKGSDPYHEFLVTIFVARAVRIFFHCSFVLILLSYWINPFRRYRAMRG